MRYDTNGRAWKDCCIWIIRLCSSSFTLLHFTSAVTKHKYSLLAYNNVRRSNSIYLNENHEDCRCDWIWASRILSKFPYQVYSKKKSPFCPPQHIVLMDLKKMFIQCWIFEKLEDEVVLMVGTRCPSGKKTKIQKC